MPDVTAAHRFLPSSQGRTETWCSQVSHEGDNGPKRSIISAIDVYVVAMDAIVQLSR